MTTNNTMSTTNTTATIVTSADINNESAFNPDYSIPSLASSGMLVRFQPKFWEATKKDVKAARLAEENLGLKRGSLSSTLHLLNGCDEHAKVLAYSRKTRTMLQEFTIQWESPWYYLPSIKEPEYVYMYTEREQENKRLYQEFRAVYPDFVADMLSKYQGAYRAEWYPTMEDLDRRFNNGEFLHDERYLQDPTDIRVATTDEALRQKQRKMEVENNIKLQKAMRGIWERLMTPIQNLADKTHQFNDKVFKNTLVTNITDLLGVMESCNIVNDQDLTDATNKLRNVLMGVTADSLRRGDDYLRTQVHQVASEVAKTTKQKLASLPSLDW